MSKREPKWMRDLKKLCDAIRAQVVPHTHQAIGYVQGCPACAQQPPVDLGAKEEQR